MALPTTTDIFPELAERPRTAVLPRAEDIFPELRQVPVGGQDLEATFEDIARTEEPSAQSEAVAKGWGGARG